MVTSPTDLRSLSPREFHLRRLSHLVEERNPYDAHWKEIVENLLPRRSRFLSSDRSRGGKINQAIIDSTATHSLNILRSGLMSGVTSPARKWFKLVTPDIELMEFGPVREWLDLVERLMYDVFRKSNFYQVLPYIYEEIAAFGTSALLQTRDFQDITRFQAFTIGEFYIAQNDRYVVDTCYRELPMTVEQLVTRYGKNRGIDTKTRWSNFSATIENHYDRGEYDVWIDTVHAITPNRDHEPGADLARNMKYRQTVFEKGADGRDSRKVLHEGGFKRFPIHTTRWDLTPPDVYGRSPGMDVLGDIKQLQDQQRKKGQALAKMVNPPMKASASMKEERMTTLPGDVTFTDLSQNEGFTPAYKVDPKLGEFVLDLEDTRQRIRRGLYTDLFLMLQTRRGVQPLNNVETEELKEEKLLALGPVFTRLDTDLLRPTIDTTFEYLMEIDDPMRGPLVPDPPKELENVELNVEYLSIISMAQRAQGLLGLQDTASFVGALAEVQLSGGAEATVLDKMDFDQAVDEYSEKRGVPAGIIRSDDAVEELRGLRAQEKQRQTMAAAMAQAPDALSKLSDVKTTEENLAADMIKGAGQGPGGVNVRTS